jgi:hypothetical protein
MGLFSDRPMYKHDQKEEYLFYLTSRNRGLWMVGPEVGQFNGGLANRGDPVRSSSPLHQVDMSCPQTCAEDTPTGQWKYTDGRSWSLDTSLSVTCVEQELLECVYSDQTNFKGGDLPAALGGGGLETSAVSSAECIEECEGREACRYWTWTGETGINCFLKTDKLTQVWLNNLSSVLQIFCLRSGGRNTSLALCRPPAASPSHRRCRRDGANRNRSSMNKKLTANSRLPA